MPAKMQQICCMDEKLSFVGDCLRGAFPMVSLCEAYGISRKTGYKWLGRHRELGPEGLLERSRAPRRPALARRIGKNDYPFRPAQPSLRRDLRPGCSAVGRPVRDASQPASVGTTNCP